MKKLIKSIKILPFLITLITSILLFIPYLRNINNYSIGVHLHVWFGLIFLIMITQKIGKDKKKQKMN